MCEKVLQKYIQIFIITLTNCCVIGELLKLWVAHQKQRVDMSTLFQQQLCREIEVLEKEVKTTQGSEAKVSSHLKVCFKTMAKSLHKQTSQ